MDHMDHMDHMDAVTVEFLPVVDHLGEVHVVYLR